VKPVGSSEEVLQIAYAAIIKQVPKELWGRLAPAGVAGVSFPVFTQQVLDQLPQGSVKVSFGELRRNAPAGVFTNSAAQDERVIDLPLSEVLAQMHPDVFACRADQVRIEISHEVPDLFGAKGERLAPVRVLDSKEATTPTARQNPPSSAHAGNILPVTPSFQTPPAARPAPAAPAPAPARAPLPLRSAALLPSARHVRPRMEHLPRLDRRHPRRRRARRPPRPPRGPRPSR